jgi:hypothetical protein
MWECRTASTKLGGCVVEDGAAGVQEFRDDDAGYRTWIGMHSDGYVLNVLRSYSPTGARIHHAGCWTIDARKVVGTVWTEQYVKVCAEDLTDLRVWAANQVGEPISPCSTCHPLSQAVSPFSSAVVERVFAGSAQEDRWRCLYLGGCARCGEMKIARRSGRLRGCVRRGPAGCVVAFAVVRADA